MGEAMKPLYTKEGQTPGQVRPADAATIILLREQAGTPFEIFMMQRHQNQSFMGSAYVFPGGRLEEGDLDPALAARAGGLSGEEARARLQEPELDPGAALGLFFAAVRETFEESGVLLAVRADGSPIDFTDAEVASRFGRLRADLNQDRTSLKTLAETENLRFRLDRLTPYTRWITPEVEGKRFDTRFLLARMPGGQAPVHDQVEMTASLWVSPAAALEEQAAGRIMLVPPTLKTMEELAAHASVDTLCAQAGSRDIRPILPQRYQSAQGFGVILPHDPEYTLEAYKQPYRPGEPSRVLMIDGRWRTVCVAPG
jgi:8-oxo-dGTP pyrophosphatase MutT (NUDIX family)